MQIVYDIFIKNWPMFLSGTINTLIISIIGTIVGFFIGLLIGILNTIPLNRKKTNYFPLKFLNALISIYVFVLRATPMIVQAMVIFYGIPLLFGFTLSRMPAALFIVSINTGAYMAEIARGGIISIDKGQYEAAKALGMNHVQTMVKIVLPQAVRNILPATGNEFIINIKDTSVLSVISIPELFFQSKSIAGANFRYFETFAITSIIYMILTFIVTKILRSLEKRMEGPSEYHVLEKQVQV